MVKKRTWSFLPVLTPNNFRCFSHNPQAYILGPYIMAWKRERGIETKCDTWL